MNYEERPSITPADKVIYVNASSLKLLTCARKYQLTNVRGYKPLKEDPILTIGKAVHKYAEGFERGIGNVEALTAASLAYPSVDGKDLINYCAGRTRVNLPPPLRLANGEKALEHHFQIAWRRYVVDGQPYVLVLCGTIDMIAVDEKGVVWVIDYKTSRRWKLDEIAADYTYDMQFRFYLWNLHRHGADIIPLDAFNSVRSGKFAAQVVGIQVGSSKTLYWHKCPPIMMNDDELAEFDDLMDELAGEQLALHTLVGTAPARGKAVGACKYCDFTRLCYAKSEFEMNSALAAFTQRPYNPKHNEELT